MDFSATGGPSIQKTPPSIEPGTRRAEAHSFSKGRNMDSSVLERQQTVPLKHDERGGKYLVFELGKEEFGIRVLKVREIMGIQDITSVPHTPAHVKGVINLRGKVIPVVDLRLKFGLPEQEYSARTCIIVVQLKGDAGPMLMGIVVDGVAEVLNLAAADIEDTPDFGDGTATPFLLGMAKVKGKVKMLLEIDQVLTSQDLCLLDAIAR
jgi:purine-binding chemotaxis protein CheW